ncbi:MAG: LptF/LptG family permease [Muribaculaceae bacterium]|nr:LptF/LptG family permease [Muribaculaceae bacterium]
MILIKRLHTFMLKTFLPLFAMTFFIVLFIVLMQFLWKYIDDLVGKGLSMGVLGELFFYAAVSMVPMALPLAILLASLMTFGNLGEKFELTAMKASGISLIRVMAPLIVTVSMIAVGAFFFQNDILPKAQVKMWTLLFSMRQKSPELEIPEEVFYDQIPGFNLYVKEKNRATGMLHEVMIYDISRGGDNATIITADSARLAMTPDMKYLYLHLWQGEQFENLRDQNNRASGANIPFRRETFLDKEVLIPFDATFNRLDEGGMRKQYVGKNIAELRHTMDSISLRLDSIGRQQAPEILRSEMPLVAANLPDPAAPPRQTSSRVGRHGTGDTGRLRAAPGSDGRPATVNTVAGSIDEGDVKATRAIDASVRAILIDTLLRSLPEGQQAEIYGSAAEIAARRQQTLSFRAQMIDDDKKNYRRHDIELIKKFTLSVACIIFFFIGAPLGAIIRKGGLGTPLVISVLLFLVYYIIDNTGYKMARDGHIIVWIGMWLSTFILAPLGVYVTWAAMNDSVVFDKDRYVALMRRITGARTKRNVSQKEVIINDVDSGEAVVMLQRLSAAAARLQERYARQLGYRRYWLKGISPDRVAEVADLVEQTVGYLHDSRNPEVIKLLNEVPVMRQVWVYRPSRLRWLSWTMIILFPLGIPVWLAGRQARRDLLADCRTIRRICVRLERTV